SSYNLQRQEDSAMPAKRIIQTLLIFILLLASFAATSPAHAWSACGSPYVVQRGDWLAKIARNCGVSLSALYAANPWVRFQRFLYPGQVLTIPGVYGSTGGLCGPGADSLGSIYIVCPGDTLGGIALYYGVSVSHIQQ